jgi:hypothetical protein
MTGQEIFEYACIIALFIAVMIPLVALYFDSRKQLKRLQKKPKRVNGRLIVKLSDIVEMKRRLKEINDEKLDNIDFVSDEGNLIKVNPQYMEDWKYIGLNNVDFVMTDFYRTGYVDEIQSKDQ